MSGTELAHLRPDAAALPQGDQRPWPAGDRGLNNRRVLWDSRFILLKKSRFFSRGEWNRTKSPLFPKIQKSLVPLVLFVFCNTHLAPEHLDLTNVLANSAIKLSTDVGDQF